MESFVGLFFFFAIFLFIILVMSVKIVSEWERLAILTLGRYSGLKGPGLVIIIPFIQTIPSRIDMRVKTSTFHSETTLTKDGVSVTVQAVLFWRVIDPQKAVLSVTNFQQAVELAAQTTLRDVIGRVALADILSNLAEVDRNLKETIDLKIKDWGIEAISVEIRDVAIPQQLQEVMSRSAQAGREKQARIIYGEAEVEAAKKFVEASDLYNSNPNALQLRAMSIMYEAVKSDQNTIIVIPSSVADAANPAAYATAFNAALNAKPKAKLDKEEPK